MGFSFRKSIKIGKNTRLNFSRKGGLGISSGVKGARISMNNNGVRTTVSKNGLQYRKDYGFGKNNSGTQTINQTINGFNNSFSDNYNIERQLLKNKKMSKKQKILCQVGLICFIMGFVNIGFIVLGIILIASSFLCKMDRVS